MRRAAWFLFAAAAPSLGAAAVLYPGTPVEAVYVVVFGLLAFVCAVALPRWLGAVVAAWWAYAVVVLAHLWVPWTGVAEVFPGVHVDPVPKVWRLAAGLVLTVVWWAVAVGPEAAALLRGDDLEDDDSGRPAVEDRTVTQPTWSGPLLEPEPRPLGEPVWLPLGVDRVAKPTPPPPGIASMLLEAWPGDAKALHLDEVADLLTMSGATTRDVRDALTGEGVRVTDRVGKRRDGRSVTKPGVRWEDVQVASQHPPSPSRGVTTP